MKTKLFKLSLIAFVSLIMFQAQAQNESATTIGKYGKDSAECVKNLSLYREFYKQKNFKDAYIPWQWVFCNCPLSSLNVMGNGNVIINEEIKNTKDQTRKELLIDSLFIVYKVRKDLYPKEKGAVLGREANDYIKLIPPIWDAKLKAEKDTLKKQVIIDSISEVWTKAYGMYLESIEIEGNKTEPSVIDAFYQTAEKYMLSKKLERDIMFEAYDKGSDIIEFNLSQSQTKFGLVVMSIDSLKTRFTANEIDSNAFNKAYEPLLKDSTKLDKDLSNFEKARNNFEKKFTPYAKCADIEKIYTKKFNANPMDIELLNKITKILNKKKCTTSPLFFNATEKLHSLQPTGQSAFMMGVMNYSKKEYVKSKEYFEEATKLLKDEDKIADAYLMLTAICMELKQYALGRAYAYKNAALKPGSGTPYLMIGDMYMTTAASCGTDELTKAAPYWAAYDKYMKAKSIDKSVEVQADANKRISQAVGRFPKKEIIFFNNLQKGQAYSIGCWIGETTIIR